ncbi:unnamed protein product [Lasius platythorax]|uniref:Uncharacterized protein n=1 Tax=Lasius platythorax TaxID=488582 RepID=A0AAV2N066_9HYME
MMIDGVHYLITRDGSRPQKRRGTNFNDCREPPYPGKRRVHPLIIPSGRRNKDEMEGNASITCFCAERPPRAFRRGALVKTSTLSLLVGRRNWVNPTSRRSPSSRERALPLPRRTWRVTFVKVHVDF